jgi:hypothetical protein
MTNKTSSPASTTINDLDATGLHRGRQRTLAAAANGSNRIAHRYPQSSGIIRLASGDDLY